MIPEIHISDYAYPLTDDRIAKYPLPERDASKLLVFRDGSVTESEFRNLSDYLPDSGLMVFNDTRVVPARLFFRRESGALIEIFCLEPVLPAEYNLSFSATDRCTWSCVIGNAKRWKEDSLHFDCPPDSEVAAFGLQARLIQRTDRTGTVEFSWTGGHSFSRVLECCGQVPIPPYLNRRTESIDKERYQTLYAHIRGSVAAPTAGLHFTPRVLDSIDARGIKRETVCLHVGAGTFLPVKGDRVSEHAMHREPFFVPLHLLKELRARKGCVAVGTTSVRTLESLYYMGVHCIEDGAPADVAQWEPYLRDYHYTTEEALSALIDWMEGKGLDTLEGGTRIIIVPGFRFRLTEAMVTNFHQSESTLILLVAAFVGEDWRRIYDYALSHGFRFLSYGDSSLLYRNSEIYG